METAEFSKFNTSPFVLMVYCHQQKYKFVDQIEKDILPAKLFSSMETSAGRMIQEVVLPVYGWEDVPSSMHSAGSVIDGKKQEAHLLKLATIKSGPRCLNDEMSKDIADDIVAHAEQWAEKAGVDHIDFTYAVLYGTPKQSNKKDWHVLRNIVEIKGPKFIIEPPTRKWNCSFRHRGVRIDVNVRIGTDWWTFLGGKLALSELLAALIRACVIPAGVREDAPCYVIQDLGSIVSTTCVPAEFNVSILQRSQLEWLFFLARHFCDQLSDEKT
ncbi:MAG: PmeII family type II restriction endonuclease [Syntrophobacteraceae bacterium]